MAKRTGNGQVSTIDVPRRLGDDDGGIAPRRSGGTNLVTSVTRVVFVLYACVALSACVFAGPPPRELVLRPGVSITAHGDKLTVTVTALDEHRRKIQWHACSLVSTGTARTERWLGVLGISDPADESIFSLRRGCEGVTRTIFEEGQLHFATQEIAQWYAEDERRRAATAIWTRDGLFVSISLVDQAPASVGRGPGAIGVDIYQFCVDGRRLHDFPQADDAAVQLSDPNGLFDCARVPASVPGETLRQIRDVMKIEPPPH